MAGPLLRRSGIAIGLIAELIEWVPDLIVQVGVGTLHHETEVFREAWPNHRLIGYEANPACYEISLKTYPGELRCVAIGDKLADRIAIYEKHRHKDGSSLFAFPDDVRVVEKTTRMTTLDCEFPEGPKAEHVLLWLDCEGSEHFALAGGARFVRDTEVINVEMTAKPYSKTWCSSKDLHNIITALGFKRQWVHTQRSSAGQCDAIYVRPHLFRSEYCCCPCQVEGDCK